MIRELIEKRLKVTIFAIPNDITNTVSEVLCLKAILC